MKTLKESIILGTRLMFAAGACLLFLSSLSEANAPPCFTGKFAIESTSAACFAVLEGRTVKFAVRANDSDGDSLSYIDPALPAGAVIDPVTRIFSWTPLANQIGFYELTFKVSDGSNVTKKVAEIHVLKKMPAVDLSIYMPPVGAQIGGSCTVWAVVCYYKTFQEGKEHNWDLTSKEHQFGQSFAYNQIVDGSPVGASFLSTFEVLEIQGSAPLSSMPNTSNFSLFPNVQQYEAAMPFRSMDHSTFFDYGYQNIITPLRQHLTNGDIFVFGVYVYANSITFSGGEYVYDGPRRNDEHDGHALAVVGFDDDKQYTNADGQISYGAFRLINSWGTRWGDSGYFWITYDAFLAYGRCYGHYKMTDRINYQPKAIACFHITHPTRKDLDAFVSVGPVSSPFWNGVRLGHHNDAAIDITDAPAQYLPPSSENKWFLRVRDMVKSGDDIGILDYFAIKYRTQTDASFRECRAPDLPIDIPNGVPITPPFYVYSYIASDIPSDLPPTKPTVNISPSMPKTTDGLVTAAGGSMDPEGCAVSYKYAWYKNGVLQSDLKASTISAGTAEKGQVWKCVVTPNDGKIDGPSGEASVTIVNSAPALALIGNKSMAEGTTLGFVVTANDVDTDILAYTAGNLPAGAVFDSASCAFMWMPTYDQQGVYPGIHFEVSDGVVKTSEDITITVEDTNRAPALSGIGDRMIENGALLEFMITAVDLDGNALILTASGLPEGADFIDNKNGTAMFSWTPACFQIGAHNIGFSADDKKGGVNSEEIVITVVDPPVAAAGEDQIIDEDRETDFNASASTDDMGIISYEWDFGDGAPKSSGLAVKHIYAEPGVYTVTLIVKDATGYSDADTLNITVLDKTAPAANAGADRVIDEDKEVNFCADGSSDNSGTIADYEWDFGDGTAKASGVNVGHIYAEPGVYIAALIARDAAGNSGSDTVTVIVRDTTPPNRPNVNIAPVLTNINKQLLSGSKDPDASIWINGEKRVSVDDNAAWSCEVILPFEGENSFKITSKDEAGNESQPEVLEIRLKTKINFNIKYPRKTYLKQSDLAYGADEIFVIYTIDDEKTEYKEKMALKEGNNTVILRAEDALGNAGGYDFSIVMDTVAPVLAITSHREGQDISSLPVILEGVVDDKASGVRLVKVNAKEANLSGGEFNAELNLSEGINDIVVEAEDNAGNVCATDFSLNYIPVKSSGGNGNTPVCVSYSFSGPVKNELPEKRTLIKSKIPVEIKKEECSFSSRAADEQQRPEDIDAVASQAMESEETLPMEPVFESEIVIAQAEEVNRMPLWREYKLKLDENTDLVALWKLTEDQKLPFLLKLDEEQGVISGIVWNEGDFEIKLEAVTYDGREIEVSCSLSIR